MSFNDNRRLLCTTLGLLCASQSLIAQETQTALQTTLRVRLRDNGPAAARVSIMGSDNKPHAPQSAVVRQTSRGASYFYADGEFQVAVPKGITRLKLVSGIEYVPQTIQVAADGPTEASIHMHRWINLRDRGWYAGDSHVHLQTGGELAVTPADALLAARAEGIAYVNLCVSNNTGDDIRGAELITGKPHPVSTNRHLLVFGEEMRSSIYGHMQFFGIRSLVEPQYTGFDNTPQSNDFPANYVMAAEAVRQGGVVTYGHPMFAGKPDPYGPDPTAGNAAARELPIDAMLGAVQAVDLMSYNSDEELSTQLWYRLLNCGLKLSACVGTDALLDRSTDPMGGGRVYVKLDGPLNMRSWLDGLKRGRTFVTNGPIPRLQVNGQSPGGTCHLTKKGNVRVDVRVDSYVPIDRIDVLVNGQIAHSRRLKAVQPEDIRLERFRIELPLQRSSWLALRVQGPDSSHVIDGPAFAHTSPVYVLVEGQPIHSSDDAAYFVDWIERLLRVVAVRNRYPTDKDRRAVEDLFRKAQSEFRLLVDK